MLSHLNNGSCSICHGFIGKYPGLDLPLHQWFIDLQKAHPEAHISCAGRGAKEQQAVFDAGMSDVRYGKSAHNWNCAVDVFVMQRGLFLYDQDWFFTVIRPSVPKYLRWGIVLKSGRLDLPHVEVQDWRKLATAGKVHLVEPMPKIT